MLKTLRIFESIYGVGDLALHKYLKQKSSSLNIEKVSDFALGVFNLGDIISTKGYYNSNDGGSANYEILEFATPDKYTVFQTGNGLFAKLIVKESMNVLQFGAIPLDIDSYDNTQTSHEQLSIAFNSAVTDLNFPQGRNFLMGEKITIFEKTGLNIIGNNSALFTDNSFVLPAETYAQSYLYILDSSEIVYDSLNMTCKETISLSPMAFQLRLRNCSQTEIKNSIFRGAGPQLKRNTISDLKAGINVNADYYETDEYKALADNIGISNLDIYSGCHNVFIDNCEFYLSHDSVTGLCFMVRDISGSTTSNIHFTNNYCEKISHDEVIAVGMESAILSELYFENNTFVMYDGMRTQSLIAVSFGSGSVAEKIRNMYIRNNNFFLQGSLYGIVFEEVDVVDSDIVFEGNYVDASSGGNTSSNAFYGIRTLPDTEQAVVLADANEFYIRNDLAVQASVECFRNINFNGNQSVTVYGNTSHIVSRSDFTQNCNFVIYGKVGVAFSRVKKLSSNSIKLNFATYIYQYGSSLGSVVIEKNRIEYLQELDENYFNIRLNSATINVGETILVEGNEYILPNPERGGSYLVDVANSAYPSEPYNMIIFNNNTAMKTDGSVYDFYLAYRFIRGIDVGYVEKN